MVSIRRLDSIKGQPVCTLRQCSSNIDILVGGLQESNLDLSVGPEIKSSVDIPLLDWPSIVRDICLQGKPSRLEIKKRLLEIADLL